VRHRLPAAISQAPFWNASLEIAFVYFDTLSLIRN